MAANSQHFGDADKCLISGNAVSVAQPLIRPAMHALRTGRWWIKDRIFVRSKPLQNFLRPFSRPIPRRLPLALIRQSVTPSTSEDPTAKQRCSSPSASTCRTKKPWPKSSVVAWRSLQLHRILQTFPLVSACPVPVREDNSIRFRPEVDARKTLTPSAPMQRASTEGSQVSLALHETDIHPQVVPRGIPRTVSPSASVSTHRYSPGFFEIIRQVPLFSTTTGAARVPVIPPVSRLLSRTGTGPKIP